MQPADDPKSQRLTPERAAVWILGIVLLSVLAFAVALVVLG